MAKPALGRGLGALLGGINPAFRPVPVTTSTANQTDPPLSPESRDGIRRVGLDQVRPCPFQPRKDFAPEALQELADSIREQGIIQPLIVRDRGDHFELIAGERRWRAAQLAGLREIPVIVREADDRAVLELALIENLQRENLNPLEEALGYSELISRFQLSQEEAGVKVGRSRAVVANALRLLKLPAEVQAHIRDGTLSVGHAKVILGVTQPHQQTLATTRVLRDGLSVRQTEELIAHLQKHAAAVPGKLSVAAPATNRDAHIASLENQLRERFGTKVTLRYRQGKGSVEIKFFSDDELERVLQIAGVAID